MHVSPPSTFFQHHVEFDPGHPNVGIIAEQALILLAQSSTFSSRGKKRNSTGKLQQKTELVSLRYSALLPESNQVSVVNKSEDQSTEKILLVEEQARFRMVLFSVKNISEKYGVENKQLFASFMVLIVPFDSINRDTQRKKVALVIWNLDSYILLHFFRHIFENSQ